MGGLGGAGAQAGGVGAAEMGDMTKKAYQRPTLDDLDIEEEEEDDMPDLEQPKAQLVSPSFALAVRPNVSELLFNVCLQLFIDII